jgi:flagellar assembly protein FliH
VPVSPFVYQPAPGWTSADETSAAANLAALHDAGVSRGGAAGDSGRREEEFRAREKQSWEQGFREGVARERADMEAAASRQRDAIAAALEAFVRERESYFHRVEAEVVALALAIVRKILRRESQVDPLLLSGLVRVALEKLALTQNVRLRVHPSQIAIWQEYFAQHDDMPVKPELSGDAALERDQCALETELGTTDLSLETQLKEIEQGLFDLLAQRPGAK